MLSIGELRTNVCGSGVFMGRGRVEVECTNLHAPHSHPSYVIYLSARSRLEIQVQCTDHTVFRGKEHDRWIVLVSDISLCT